MIAVINTYPYLLFRLEEKINEGKRNTEKAKGTIDFHHLGPHRIYDTNSVNDWLDGIYGIFYELNKTLTLRRTDLKTEPSQ